jgi:hypothetical protein
MSDWVNGHIPAALLRAQRKIERWRERHRPRSPLPEELWREATELVGVHGVNRTARALRLDYYSLKKRVTAAAAGDERAPQFVEVLPGGLPDVRPQCLIELEDAGGAKMRIHLQGGDLPNVAALTSLVRVFRECH